MVEGLSCDAFRLGGALRLVVDAAGCLVKRAAQLVRLVFAVDQQAEEFVVGFVSMMSFAVFTVARARLGLRAVVLVLLGVSAAGWGGE